MIVGNGWLLVAVLVALAVVFLVLPDDRAALAFGGLAVLVVVGMGAAYVANMVGAVPA